MNDAVIDIPAVSGKNEMQPLIMLPAGSTCLYSQSQVELTWSPDHDLGIEIVTDDEPKKSVDDREESGSRRPPIDGPVEFYAMSFPKSIHRLS